MYLSGRFVRDRVKGRKHSQDILALAVRETREDLRNSTSWILDSGSSRHLVNDLALLSDTVEVTDNCVLADGSPMMTSVKGNVMLRIAIGNQLHDIQLTDVHYAPSLARNIISYGKLENKGCVLRHNGRQRQVVVKKTGQVVFPVHLANNVLTVHCLSKGQSRHAGRALCGDV